MSRRWRLLQTKFTSDVSIDTDTDIVLYFAGQITLSGRVSSQYLTALLMAAPLAEGEGATEIISEGLISQPYVRMTIALMKQFCVQVTCSLRNMNQQALPTNPV